MKVLVTGGAGFIGSHTVDHLLERGYDVRVLDSLVPPVHAPGQLPNYLPWTEIEFIRGDVGDPASWELALAGVDAVFHLAAYQDYLSDFSRFFAVNSVSTALLYEQIVNRRLPIQKVVVASSQAIYGEGKYECQSHGAFYPDQRPLDRLERGEWDILCPECDNPMEPTWTSEMAARPHNSYALSKRDQEEIALKLGRRYAIPSVALRYSIVQGPRQSFRNAYSGSLRSFAVRVLAGQPPVLYEDGQQLRDYVSIHDVARANMLALEDPRADYQSFNVGGGSRISVRALAEIVLSEAGSTLEPETPGIFRVGDTRHVFSDVRQLKTLGWTIERSTRQTVREYLAWAIEQPELRDTFGEARAHMAAAGVLRSTRRLVMDRVGQPREVYPDPLSPYVTDRLAMPPETHAVLASTPNYVT